MRTVLLGKKIENIYDVNYKWKEIKDENGESKTVFTGKPEVTKETKIEEWVELCSYKGEPRYNSNLYMIYLCKTVNISENESVKIEEEIFRADLNEMHLHTDKVVEEIDVKKEEAFSACEAQIKAFNKMMIESNDKMKAYCDLHKLSYAETDCIELFNLIFPNEEYIIEDGVMKVKEKPVVYYGGLSAVTISDECETTYSGVLSNLRDDLQSVKDDLYRTATAMNTNF